MNVLHCLTECCGLNEWRNVGAGNLASCLVPKTETDTEKDKLAQNPIEIFTGVCFCVVETHPYNSMHRIFYLFFYQSYCQAV